MTSGPAKLTNTFIMSLKLDEQFHLTAYSNKVENLSGKPNAMILPVPGILKKEYFFDTTDYANFLQEIETAQKAKHLAKSRSISAGAKTVENFSVGMYNVFLSSSATAIKEVIAQLPEDKQPKISDELFSFFNSHYEGWSFVVAVFESDKKMDSQPIMFKYEPFDLNMLFFPGMDAHDGYAPKLDKHVDVEHFLITEIKNYKLFEFTSKVPDFLKNRYLIGQNWSGAHKNGDWYKDLSHKQLDFSRHTEVLIKKPVVVPAE